MLWISLAVGGLVAGLTFRLLFHDWETFNETLLEAFQPGAAMPYTDLDLDNFWPSLKIGLWLLLSWGAGQLTYLYLPQLWAGNLL